MSAVLRRAQDDTCRLSFDGLRMTRGVARPRRVLRRAHAPDSRRGAVASRRQDRSVDSRATTKEVRSVALRMLLPLAVSSAAWAFDIATLSNAQSIDLEGDYYLTAFVGVLCFVATGPLAGALLGRWIYDRTMPLSIFLALFFGVSIPILSFQIVAYSSSILSGFMIGGPWTIHDMSWFYAQAIVLALASYGACAIILHTQATVGVARCWIAAGVLAAALFAIIALRVLHS